MTLADFDRARDAFLAWALYGPEAKWFRHEYEADGFGPVTDANRDSFVAWLIKHGWCQPISSRPHGGRRLRHG